MDAPVSPKFFYLPLCFFLLLSQLMVRVDATATLSIQMITYKNSNSRDWDNDQCDLVFNTECDNLFDFCIHRANGDDAISNCHYGSFSTGEFRNNDNIRFEADMFGVANPIVLKLNIWRNIKFKVRVRDDDSHSNHDLVDFYTYTWSAVPGVNNTDRPTTSTVLLLGQRSRATKTSLNVKFSVKCDLHYYGTDCNNYCRYTNDGTGHFMCDSRGQRVCLPGWEDAPSSCTIRSDDCIGHTCKNGATCVDGRRTYSCNCPAHFTGSRCETRINYCQSNPCQNNGTCVDVLGRYECQCPPGYPAVLAADCSIHICENENPCQNGGTCYENGKCLCAPNFTGDRCERHFCEVNCIFCQNGGICNGTACQCPKGTAGERCEVVICDLIECFNGGTCEDGTCSCKAGFTGRFCEENIDDCGSFPCLNDGSCVDGVQSYRCICVAGYNGSICDFEIPTTTYYDTTSPAMKATKTVVDIGAGQNVADRFGYSTSRPCAVVTDGFPKNLFLAMLVCLVVLVLIIIILIAFLCRERTKRKLKEQAARGNGDATGGQYENPVYIHEQRSQHATPNSYSEQYLQPSAAGGAVGQTREADGKQDVLSKIHGLDDSDPHYSHPPYGSPRSVSVHNGNIYDHPRPLAELQQPPPYSPPAGAEANTYNHSIDNASVSMNDIKARVEEDGEYEEIATVKTRLP